MGCSCGCAPAARASVSSLARKRSLGRLGRSRLAIGASAASVVGQFDLDQYIPPDVQADVAQASSYYQQFQTATQGMTVSQGANGWPTVQISPAAQQALMVGMTAALQVVPVLGQAFAVFEAIAPQAGAGAGECSENPPSGPLLSQLQSWKYFQSWDANNGPYHPGSSGSFEAFANPILEYNWLLGANCFYARMVPSPVLLAQLVNAWNATHSGPSRTITRSGLNPPGWGFVPGYDPIAQALENARITQALQGGPPAPSPFSMSLSVNSGPRKVQIVSLHLRPTATAAAPAPSSAGRDAATVAVLALGGAAAFYVHARGLPPFLRRL